MTSARIQRRCGKNQKNGCNGLPLDDLKGGYTPDGADDFAVCKVKGGGYRHDALIGQAVATGKYRNALACKALFNVACRRD